MGFERGSSLDTRPLYTSFDRVPAPKGASTHIAAFCQGLAGHLGAIDLLTPGDDLSADGASDSSIERWPGVFHSELPAGGPNIVARVLEFRGHLGDVWRRRGKRPVVHFRSIWEGYPIARAKKRAAEKIVFEVNGLTSIELKYHHPDVADDRELMNKIRYQEDCCLSQADMVVTPSPVTADYLATRGVGADRVRVIPNGVDLSVFAMRAQPPEIEATRPLRVLYSGTHSPWQGLRQAVDAIALYRRDADAKLIVVGPTRGFQRKELMAWIDALGLTGSVELRAPMPQDQLAALHAEVDAVLAPLTVNDRNTVQGCCPLKVLEAMATGTPVIASDLPVIRHLATGDCEALLVRPGSPKAIKDAMNRIQHEPGLAARLGQAARAKVEQMFTWEHATGLLADAYRDIGFDGTLAG